jgi:hypothetical protein
LGILLHTEYESASRCLEADDYALNGIKDFGQLFYYQDNNKTPKLYRFLPSSLTFSGNKE